MAFCYISLEKQKGAIAMDIRNIDIYNLPKWFSDIIEEIDILCEEALRSSVSYSKITEERYRILDKHDFISRLTDDGGVEEPMELTAGETKALSRFFTLEYDKARAESIQMYLLGCSHIFKLLRMLEEI